MHSTKVFCIMISHLLIAPIGFISENTEMIFLNGYVGYDTPYNNAYDICKVDSALQFIGCNYWIDMAPTDLNYRSTIVVIDDGLCVDQWKDLESGKFGFGVDIVKYLTPKDHIGTFEVITYGEYGRDNLNGITNIDLNCQEEKDHGFAVISALATIVPYIKVIFVNSAETLDKPDGFLIHINNHPWKWIKDNVARYDIDIITASVSTGYEASEEVKNTIAEIHNKGVFMVTAIGNKGIYEGNNFPQEHQYFYTVGSVDHEDRAAWAPSWEICRSWFYCKPTYYYYVNGNSWKGHHTGEAPVSTFGSSYGSGTASHAEALDFVMPGHGIPALSYKEGKWRDSMGTSLSAPYLAAAAVIAVYAYNLGYKARNGYEVDPNPSLVYDLLKDASHSIMGGWHYRFGWGHVNLLELYNEAYMKGYNTVVAWGWF